MTEEALFAEALKKRPEDRAAFLAQACGGDEKLRAAVEGLLRGHEQAGLLPGPPLKVSAQTVRLALAKAASRRSQRIAMLEIDL